jgi:acyl-CoA thioester hydrolase
MSAQFTTTCRVEFSDTDMAGIVHFTNFYLWMEHAEHAWFRSLGLKIIEEQSDGSTISWPRGSCACSFKAPAYYNDVLEVRLTAVRKGEKSLTMQFEFYRDETQIAVGELKTVCCRIREEEPLRSIRIPPEYDEKIQEL